MTKHPIPQRDPEIQQSDSAFDSFGALSCFVIPSFLGFSGVDLHLAFIAPGGGELLLILLVLILLFGPKDAPRILRNIQTTLNKLQRAAADFRYKLMYSDLHQPEEPAVPVTYDTEEDPVEEVHDSPPEDKPDAEPEKHDESF